MRSASSGAYRERLPLAWPAAIRVALLLAFQCASANAGVDLAVEVNNPAAFYESVSLDSFLNLPLSDYFLLADGEHHFRVSGSGSYAGAGIFYSLGIVLDVSGATVTLRRSDVYERCIPEGRPSVVKEWPAPVVEKDARFSGAFKLQVTAPTLSEATAPCRPMEPPSIARWSTTGVVNLAISSEPAGSEVIIGGRLVGRAGESFNVPYAQGETLLVIVRQPGYVNCQWNLPAPHEANLALRCEHRVPGGLAGK